MNPDDPYAYQDALVARCVRSVRGSDAYADTSSTGVGKTAVAMKAAKELGLRPLVVCPKAVRPHWEEMAALFDVELLEVDNYEGYTRTTRSDHGKWRVKKRVWNWLTPLDAILIFDEAHRLGGPTSQVSKLLVAATRQRIPTILLSATLADSPLKMKAIGYALGLHNYDDYRWWLPTVGCKRDDFGRTIFVGGAETMERIRQEIGPRIGGLTHAEIPDFPRNSIDTLTVPVDLDVDAEYRADLEEMREDAVDEVVVGLRSRQLAELGKVPALVEMAKDLIAQGNSVALFVNFTDSCDRLTDALSCGAIRGGQTADERSDVILGFQSNENHAVVVMTQAGGQGISLHDLHGRPRVSLISPSWSAVDFRQALGRIHRAGSLSPSVQRIVFADGSEVEGRIRSNVAGKLARIDQLNDHDLSIS